VSLTRAATWFFAAFASGIAWKAWRDGYRLSGDANTLLLMALHIARGGVPHGFGMVVYSGQDNLGVRSPWAVFLYALPLALRSLRALSLLEGLIRALAAGLCFRCALRATGSGLVACIAVVSLRLFEPVDFNDEWLVIPLALLAVEQLVAFEDHGSLRSLAACAFLLGFAAIEHPESFVLLAVVAWVRWHSDRRAPPRGALVFALLFLLPFGTYLLFPFAGSAPAGRVALLLRSNVIFTMFVVAAVAADPVLLRRPRWSLAMAGLLALSGVHVAWPFPGPSELRLFGLRLPLHPGGLRPTLFRWAHMNLFLLIVIPAVVYIVRVSREPVGVKPGKPAHQRALWAWLLIGGVPSIALATLGDRVRYGWTFIPALVVASAGGLRELAMRLRRTAPGKTPIAPVRRRTPLVAVLLCVVGFFWGRGVFSTVIDRLNRDQMESIADVEKRLDTIRDEIGLDVVELQTRIHGLPRPDVPYCTWENGCFLALGVMRSSPEHRGAGSQQFYFAARPRLGVPALWLDGASVWLVPYDPALQLDSAAIAVSSSGQKRVERPRVAMPVRVLSAPASATWQREFVYYDDDFDLRPPGEWLEVSIPRSAPRDPRLNAIEVAASARRGSSSPPCTLAATVDDKPLVVLSETGARDRITRFSLGGRVDPLTLVVRAAGCVLTSLDVYDVMEAD
jgi:hypothetical protein